MVESASTLRCRQSCPGRTRCMSVMRHVCAWLHRRAWLRSARCTQSAAAARAPEAHAPVVSGAAVRPPARARRALASGAAVCPPTRARRARTARCPTPVLAGGLWRLGRHCPCTNNHPKTCCQRPLGARWHPCKWGTGRRRGATRRAVGSSYAWHVECTKLWWGLHCRWREGRRLWVTTSAVLSARGPGAAAAMAGRARRCACVDAGAAADAHKPPATMHTPIHDVGNCVLADLGEEA